MTRRIVFNPVVYWNVLFRQTQFTARAPAHLCWLSSLDPLVHINQMLGGRQ